MKAKKNIFIVSAISFLLVFVPVLCCCLDGKAQANVQAPSAELNHGCCDAQATSNPPEQDNCDCPNHSLAKAANVVYDSLTFLSSQSHSSYPVFITLHLYNGDPRHASASKVVHSPPIHSSDPLYIEFRNLRL